MLLSPYQLQTTLLPIIIIGSSRQVGAFGKSFTRSCFWHFGMKLRHSIPAVSGAPLSSSRLEEAL